MKDGIGMSMVHISPGPPEVRQGEFYNEVLCTGLPRLRYLYDHPSISKPDEKYLSHFTLKEFNLSATPSQFIEPLAWKGAGGGRGGRGILLNFQYWKVNGGGEGKKKIILPVNIQ